MSRPGIRAYVNFDFLTQRLELTIVRDADPPQIWRGPDGWVPVDPQVVNEPSIRFSWETSDAVVEAFARHIASTSGYVPTEARKDYLDERRRVDQLQEALISLAIAPYRLAP